jgi:hypothetical protein
MMVVAVTQRGRLEEVRDNLQARIAEATREGWLGEVEGLQVSLAGGSVPCDRRQRRMRFALSADLIWTWV